MKGKILSLVITVLITTNIRALGQTTEEYIFGYCEYSQFQGFLHGFPEPIYDNVQLGRGSIIINKKAKTITIVFDDVSRQLKFKYKRFSDSDYTYYMGRGSELQLPRGGAAVLRLNKIDGEEDAWETQYFFVIAGQLR